MDYDQIGKTYTATRHADRRITDKLVELLNLPAGCHLVDIGAGTGNYSAAIVDKGYKVTAIEPSQVMHDQAQQRDNLYWVKASGEEIPAADGEFAGAVMTLCLHHLKDWQIAIQEALRVTAGGPLIIFAFDIEQKADFWLFEYFPTLDQIDQQWPPSMSTLRRWANESNLKFERTLFPLPKDLIDHFLAAGWAKPHIYLEESYRKGISSFSEISEEETMDGVNRLRNDLSDGSWNFKFGDLLKEEFHDRGYGFVKIKS